MNVRLFETYQNRHSKIFIQNRPTYRLKHTLFKTKEKATIIKYSFPVRWILIGQPLFSVLFIFQLVAFASLATINNPNYRLLMLYLSLESTFLNRKSCENVRKKITSFETVYCLFLLVCTSSANHARHGFHATRKLSLNLLRFQVGN